MQMYVVLSHNDGAGETLHTTAPFHLKDDAIDWMRKDISTVCNHHKISDDDFIDDDGAAIEVCGVMYEWAISPIEIPEDRAVVRLDNNTSLVADVDKDGDFRMIYVGFERDGFFTQDLVSVGEDYEFADDLEVIHKSGVFAVRVYSDDKSEDYTHKFYIKQYLDEF